MTLPLALTLGSLIVATNSRQEFITEPEHQVGTFSCLCILIMMMMIIIIVIIIVIIIIVITMMMGMNSRWKGSHVDALWSGRNLVKVATSGKTKKIAKHILLPTPVHPHVKVYTWCLGSIPIMYGTKCGCLLSKVHHHHQLIMMMTIQVQQCRWHHHYHWICP